MNDKSIIFFSDGMFLHVFNQRITTRKLIVLFYIYNNIFPEQCYNQLV